MIFGFLQFLGLYSEYAIEWPESMQGLFDALLFFNLDVDMMQFQCWNSLSWETLFLVQAFVVPVLHPLVALIHLGLNYVLKLVTERGQMLWLLRIGWRPRRDFSPEAILYSYGPVFILYLNIYYITGIGVALKPLICAGEEGHQYLKYAPHIECWSDTHYRILGYDSLAILLYFVSFPGLIIYVLFRLVPMYGLRNERLNMAFGFLWSRFEVRSASSHPHRHHGHHHYHSRLTPIPPCQRGTGTHLLVGAGRACVKFGPTPPSPCLLAPCATSLPTGSLAVHRGFVPDAGHGAQNWTRRRRPRH
jgi:hypothetical protein